MAAVDTDVPMGPSGEGSSAGASSSSRRPKRFEIKKWNAVALWAWGTNFVHSLFIADVSLFVPISQELIDSFNF